MSGWKRLGVVASVLWLIGPPVYFQVEEFLRIEREFEACTSLSPAQDVLARQRQLGLCNDARNIKRGNHAAKLFAQLKLMTFIHDHPDAWTLGVMLWLMWLGPVALIWIVGAIVISTTRWVIRGFTKSDTKRV